MEGAHKAGVTVQIECPYCMTRRCHECKQSGYIKITPDEIEPACRAVSEVQRAWVFLQNHQVLPDPGGLYDQAEPFVTAALVLDQLEALATRLEIDEAKANAAKGKSGPTINPRRK